MKFDVERFKREKISLHSRDANEFAEIVRFLKTTDVTIYIEEDRYNPKNSDFVINWGGEGMVCNDNYVKYGPADYHAGYGWKVVTVDELQVVEISADAVMDLLKG